MPPLKPSVLFFPCFLKSHPLCDQTGGWSFVPCWSPVYYFLLSFEISSPMWPYPGFRCHFFLPLPINLLCPQSVYQTGGVLVPSFPDFTDNFTMSPNFCSGITPGQKWWPTVLGKRNPMQPMGRLSMHSCWALFFPFGSGVGWAELFFVCFFPCFWMCSQRILKFPKCS